MAQRRRKKTRRPSSGRPSSGRQRKSATQAASGVAATESRAGSRVEDEGRLRIGDDWNAISIIALSQSNPLKAVAEFVENSLDAGARNVVIVRGKEAGQMFLRISDDGNGIPLDDNGLPNFKYVATHICDSIKRQLKSQGQTGIQGEFGIGLLSFWTVGEELSIVSAGRDGRSYEMRMKRGVPTYRVQRTRRLLSEPGTELTIRPLLSGIKHFSGEKLQWYLAAELRDRIRNTHARVRIVDRQSRQEYAVEPRQFSGQLLHLPAPRPAPGEIYVELYLAEPGEERHIGLCRAGTRVLPDITEIAELNRHPWNSRYLEGLIDAPFLTISPGTRSGVIHDQALTDCIAALQPIEEALDQLIRRQEEAEQERASRQTWRSIRRAFQEALLALPDDEYDWFRIGREGRAKSRTDAAQPGLPLHGTAAPDGQEASEGGAEDAESTEPAEFFEHPGPLFSVRVSPASSVVAVGQARSFQALPRDRSRRPVVDQLSYEWRILEGSGTLSAIDDALVSYTAPDEPQLAKLLVTVTQNDVTCQAEALVTVTDSLLPDRRDSQDHRGLPGYTFEKAPGQLWRSRFDLEQNVIVINNGHRDFVYASRNKSLQLRYICRLYAKELVVNNFPGQRPEQLLERMIELSLYTEENLR